MEDHLAAVFEFALTGGINPLSFSRDNETMAGNQTSTEQGDNASPGKKQTEKGDHHEITRCL